MKVETLIAKNDSGQRADRYVRRYLASLSLARIQSLFRKKEIKVNRKPIDRAHVLAEGDKLEIFGLTPEQAASAGDAVGEGRGAFGAASRPGTAPFPILLEDDELLVVNKPAGLAVHPGTGITPGRSLIELAQHYLGRQDSLFQPALVHRLDKETSGVLLIAKTGGSLRALTAALRAGELRKEYVALLIGKPPKQQGTLHDRLERQDSRHGGAKTTVQKSGHRQNQTYDQDAQAEGKEAITHYEVLQTFGTQDMGAQTEGAQTSGVYTLVRAIIETGRMHQIRAQFSHAGCPLAGDRRYAPAEANAAVRETLGLRRLFLHARSLTWNEGRQLRIFEAPLPDDLQKALSKLQDDGQQGLRVTQSSRAT